MKFMCTEKCWHGGHLYVRGEMARFSDEEDGPWRKVGNKKKLAHFVKVNEPAPIEVEAKTVKVNGK